MTYHLADIKVNLNPAQTWKTKGYLINKWLCTGYANNRYESIKVFNCFGFPVTNIGFSEWEDVNKFAEFLDTLYNDYWILWFDNPEADVPGLTRYTIEDGLAIQSAFEALEGKIISFEDVMDECTRHSS